jgi:tRNA 5-methylaminomethyl-2-thiouridine biosynthesis bifunctional protein
MCSIEWDSQGQPLSTRFDDVYFSHENGLAESRFVFLKHNELPERFSTLDDHTTFTVGETGFGTGLNFLACWQLWQQRAPSSARLTYISIEKYPLTPSELSQSLSLWPELQAFSEQLTQQYQHQYPGHARHSFHCLQFGNVRLILIFDDAEKAIKDLYDADFPNHLLSHWRGVDAWFLDGFAPAKNPDMWSEALLVQLGNLSHKDTTFATFTAAGIVKRSLLKAGFEIKKVPGFGKKREMLTGHYQGPANYSDANLSENHEVKPASTPWPVISNFVPAEHTHSIAIIGAGLAGCHTARALARKGFQVTLFEQQQNVAQAASGNPQGILYAKLSPHREMLGEFNLYSLLFSQNYYQDFWRQKPEQGQACGVLQVSKNQQSQQQHRDIAGQLKASGFVKYLSVTEASNIAQLPLEQGGLFFPYSGWLNPQALCQWLISEDKISINTSTKVTALSFQNKRWQLTIEKQGEELVQSFDQLVIASAQDAKNFAQTQWLPTKTIRGQISYIDSTPATEKLNIAICGKGYMAPASFTDNSRQGPIQTIGASFNLHDDSIELSNKDHQHNIENICQHLADINSLEVVGGRTAFRCTSPDYMPLVGPVPNVEQFKQDYAPLSRNAQKPLASTGRYLPNLFINIAHGSRGIAYTPLTAEILASLIAGEAPPTPQALVDRLNPARFIIRNLIRGK